MNIENLVDIIKFVGRESRIFLLHDVWPTRERETLKVFNRYVSSYCITSGLDPEVVYIFRDS